MNFPEDTMEQKAESVGRVMPHTEVSPGPTSYHVAWGGAPLGTRCFPSELTQDAESTPSSRGFPGPGLGLLCGLRP